MTLLAKIFTKSTAWLHRFDGMLQVLDGSAADKGIARQKVLIESLEDRVRALESERADR